MRLMLSGGHSLNECILMLQDFRVVGFGQSGCLGDASSMLETYVITIQC